jgi:hypothetical protein
MRPPNGKAEEKENTMKVKIKETGKIETLSVIDPQTGCCYVSDLIGNADGFSQFERDEASDTWLCDQETFDWWLNYIRATEKSDAMVEELKDVLGSDLVFEMVADACDGVEFGDLPFAVAPYIKDVMEDGEALGALGITQEQAEEAHSIVAAAI